ncbi:PorP/SprF family type IX secretion system membrane protein [Hugenholtzia roseola]|uniref:PorP/SprF family type IX secretion system membrane protein n=1 Tax=Hugenholtzia roseola TaxID=1002 RepID=UPI000A323163|nr:type IX secretion system membrane protein PorP/SprF [Hugenholtzia roseola]
MKKNLYLFLAFCVGFGFFQTQASAQQDAQFSQYMFNTLYFNPATAGRNSDFIEMGAVYRSQWAGYTATFDQGGAPATQVVSISAPLNRINSGIGLHLAVDRLGPLSSTEVMLSYAYHVALKNEGKLSIGLRAGVYNQAIDFSLYRPNEAGDPNIPQGGKENQFKPDLSAGIFYENPKFFAGAGITHLLPTQFNYGTQINISSLTTHANLMVGGKFDLTESLFFSPSAMLQTDFNTFSYQGNALFTLQDRYHLGLGARASNAFDDAILMVGANLLEKKDLRIMYSFDLVVSGQPAKQPTSHEVTIGFRLPAPSPAILPTQRTTRFRF